MDRELQLKIMHAEARRNHASDLMQWAALSQDGGEYYISVNGNRMWVSLQEVTKMLNGLRCDLSEAINDLKQRVAPGSLPINWEEK